MESRYLIAGLIASLALIFAGTWIVVGLGWALMALGIWGLVAIKAHVSVERDREIERIKAGKI